MTVDSPTRIHKIVFYLSLFYFAGAALSGLFFIGHDNPWLAYSGEKAFYSAAVPFLGYAVVVLTIKRNALRINHQTFRSKIRGTVLLIGMYLLVTFAILDLAKTSTDLLSGTVELTRALSKPDIVSVYGVVPCRYKITSYPEDIPYYAYCNFMEHSSLSQLLQNEGKPIRYRIRILPYSRYIFSAIAIQI